MKRVLLFAFFILSTVPGCGPGEAKVTGRVLLDGNPLPAGRVTFRPADARMNSVSVEVDEQGTYQTLLPVGDVAVSVDNREWEPQPVINAMPLPPGLTGDVKKALEGTPAPSKTGKASPPRSKKYVKIPDRYYDAESSSLQFTVIRGQMTKDIELKR